MMKHMRAPINEQIFTIKAECQPISVTASSSSCQFGGFVVRNDLAITGRLQLITLHVDIVNISFLNALRTVVTISKRALSYVNIRVLTVISYCVCILVGP